MTTQPTQSHQIQHLTTKAKELTSLLSLCHTLEDCTAQDRKAGHAVDTGLLGQDS